MDNNHHCEAFYICRKFGKIVAFDYFAPVDKSTTLDEFNALSGRFIEDVRAYGAGLPFPDSIADHLSGEELDEAMLDVEFNAEQTFFIATTSMDTYRKIFDGEQYKMIGNNGTNTAFESMNGEKIEVCKSSDAPAIYSREKTASIPR